MRVGTVATKPLPPLWLVASVNQPLTSTTRSVLPPRLKRLTWPLVPTGTVTRLGRVWPALQFRLEASGRACPAGHTVRKLSAVVSVAVTFRTTAETPEAGTPPRPVTCRVSVCAGPTAAMGAPLPMRVSSRREGERALNIPNGPLELVASPTQP